MSHIEETYTMFCFFLKKHYFRDNRVLSLFNGLEAKLLQTVLTAALIFLIYENVVSCTFRIMGLSKH